MLDKGAFVEQGLAKGKAGKHPGGRPRRDVDLSRVRELLHQGASLRQAARQLGLGYGTIHRAIRSTKSQPAVIQNPIAEAL
jgi:DNA invertase Pin-like site-specific DNA recombinase